MRATRSILAGLCCLALAACHLLVSTDDLFVKMVPTSVAQDGQTTTMSSPVVSLAFDCATAGCALSAARIAAASGEDLIYEGEASAERLAGISFWDHAYSWQSDAVGGLTVVQAGGPVSRVQIDWHTADAEGTSLYTLHPDGRLYRYEVVDLSQTYPGVESFLLAYLSLDATLLTTLAWRDGFDAGTSQPMMSNQFTHDSLGVGYACAANAREGDVVSWAHHDSSAAGLLDWRLWEVADDTSSSILMASDWVNNSEPTTTHYTGQFLTVFGSSGNCDDVREQTALFQQPPILDASVGSVVTDQPGDGDHDGFNEGGGFFELQAESDEVRVEAYSNLPTSTLRIWGAPTRSVPEITLGGDDLENGRDFLVGAGAQGEVWLFFDRPWAAGSELRIRWP